MTRSFSDHICFSPGTAGIVTIGVACRHLSDAMKDIPEAAEARLALGDPFNRQRNAKALAILQSLPPWTQSQILTADARRRVASSRKSSAAEA